MSNRLFEIRLNGRWLREIGPWTDLTMSWSWGGGSKEASWSSPVRYGVRNPLLRRNATVQIYWSGWPIWSGYLSEPDWNGDMISCTANGLFRRGEQYKAFTDPNASATTDNPTTAINAATGIGWTIGAGIPNYGLAGTTGPVNSISQVLDAHAAALGQRWTVDPFGIVSMSGDPTNPTYLIRAGVGDLGIAEDNYASHVVLRYASTDGTYKSAIYPGPLRGGTPNIYEARFGHLETTVEATDRGPIADATAASLAQQVYQRTYQRPGWTNGLQVARGEILNVGGKALHPATIRPGTVARLLGVRDEVGLTSYTDFVIGEVQYKDGEQQVTINPVGLVSRSQEDVLTELLEAMFPDGEAA